MDQILDDTETVDFIRRANLDTFWSRDTDTIGNTLANLNCVL
jgi:hypothetical protein